MAGFIRLTPRYYNHRLRFFFFSFGRLVKIILVEYQ